jgi:hypothetical protein
MIYESGAKVTIGAKTKHTLYFSAPLYRKNLHYSVVPKPSSSEAAIQVMANYILEHHKDESGIVYCLSKNVCTLAPPASTDGQPLNFGDERTPQRSPKGCKPEVKERSEQAFTTRT